MSTAAPPLPAEAGADPWCPQFARVIARRRESGDVVSLVLEPDGGPWPLAQARPGQFAMLYAFGVGEVPVSYSAIGDDGRLTHTVRAVGRVSAALTRLRRGDQVGVRGPFGSCWPLAEAAGSDLLLIAGGIGLAPLRPALQAALAGRQHHGSLALLYGAREPSALIFRRDLERWRATPGLQFKATVDRADRSWRGHVGVVTQLIGRVRFSPSETVAFVCGPEVMMRFTVEALCAAGVPAERIWLSMERNMQCAIGLCGHCQLGTELVCRDGAVFAWPRLAPLMGVREL